MHVGSPLVLPWVVGMSWGCGGSLASAEDLEEHDLWGAVEMNQELSSKVAKAKAKAKAAENGKEPKEPKKKGPKQEAKARDMLNMSRMFSLAFLGTFPFSSAGFFEQGAYSQISIRRLLWSYTIWQFEHV